MKEHQYDMSLDPISPFFDISSWEIEDDGYCHNCQLRHEDCECVK